MLPRCLRFNQCIGVDLVDSEVRDETSVKALNVVCWRTELHIIQALWNGYTANAVMTEFKASWVEHCGWPEILVHDQGPEFMGSEFRNQAGAAIVLTMPVDSQSPGIMEKQKEQASRSNASCGTWTKNVMLKEEWILKRRSLSVAIRGIVFATDLVSLRTNVFLDPVCACLAAC